MKVKESISVKIFKVFNYVLLSFLSIICLYPFWYVVVASLSNGIELMRQSGLMLLPAGFSLDAYKIVLEDETIGTGFFNTFLLLIVGIPVNVSMTALGAYFFSRKNVLFRKPLMLFCMFTMYFSGGTIPFYLTLKDLHLIGNRFGVVIAFAIATYNMIILRTAFESIPDSLIEAARIDGAGHIRILFKVVLPLSKATLAVIAMYYGMSTWNAWFWSSTILRDKYKLPLQAVLRNMIIEDSAGGEAEILTLVTVKYSTIVVSLLPVLVVYPFMQRYFVKGVLIGGVKE